MKTYNPVLMFKGRSGAFHSTSMTKLILESSPFEIGDYLYSESHKSGCLVVRPHYKCPHCGHWQEWADSQIKLRKIDGKEPDHTPERIRDLGESAVYYECVECTQEITETQRASVDADMVWAAPKIDDEDFKQDAEKINDDGTIPGRLAGGKRKGFDSIVYQASRLVDVSYPFYKCLALFFESKNDPEAKRTYETETMARWPKRQSRKIEVSYLEAKKVKGFYQYGDKHRIPEDVVALTFGGDTQKDGFYYTIFGWGYMMSCWLIRHDFIKCPVDPNENHQLVYGKFRESLYIEPLLWADGTEADFKFGLLDRGGHRPDDVDEICKRMPNIKPYIGATRIDDKKPAIYKSETGSWFMGQPQMLSDFTGTLLGSEYLYFPWDTGAEFFDQVWRQFFEKRINAKGEKEEVWVHGYAGPDKSEGSGADHYRDCFNYSYAAAKLAGLDKKLFNENYCNTMKSNRSNQAFQEIKVEKPLPQEATVQRVDPRKLQQRQSGYFKRAYGRRF
jgi:phage terminase large subunit GpA-like protein